MSRYIYGKNRRNWNDPSSKYGLEPWKFDEDIQRNIERKQKKEKEIRKLLNELIEREPDRQEETFGMIIDWAREWRRLNDA